MMDKHLLVRPLTWSFLALVVTLSCQTRTVSIPPTASPAEITYRQSGAPSIAPAADFTATTYYVDGADGSDSNPGTSRDHAWQTIQQAADTMVAGDYCIVLAGNYDERVHVATSGSSGAPITYWAEGTVTMKGFTVQADYITIRGFDITNTEDLWDDGVGVFVEGSRCVIEDNYIYFATRGGIVVYASPPDAPTSSDCVIRNNRLHRNASVGIDINGRNHLIEGNEIWRTIQYHPNWTDPPSWVDADGMVFFGTGHTIRGNYIHDIRMDDPENVDPHIDCFQTWGPAYDIVFERNFCENLNEDKQGFMIEELHSPVRDLTIRNNGLQTFSHLNVFDCENITIVNNTFTSDLSFASQNQLGIELNDSPNATIKNNIFYDLYNHHLAIDGSSLSGTDVGYNNVYRSDGQPPLGSPLPHDLWDVDPMFVDPAGNDFHLQSASPCIDAGDDLGSQVPDDFAGNPRPQGAGYDIGAVEYTANSQPPGELIIDDIDDGFSTSFTQDDWQEYLEPGGAHYGNTHHYNGQIGSGDDAAAWSFRVPQQGHYQVYAWWVEGSDRPEDVPYIVQDLDGPTTIRVNQQINGGQWNLLGSFCFLSQGSVQVSDDASSGQDIIADAVRLVYVGPLSSVYLPVLIRSAH
jgi:hypothetical protein